MYKLMLMMKRRPGMSKQAFREHYENVHVPLGEAALPYARRYVRNYTFTYPGRGDAESELPYDCVTELWFDSEADCQRNMQLLADNPRQAAEIAADEDNFLDRGKTLWFVSEQEESALA